MCLCHVSTILAVANGHARRTRSLAAPIKIALICSMRSHESRNSRGQYIYVFIGCVCGLPFHNQAPNLAFSNQHDCMFSRMRLLVQTYLCVRFARRAREHRDILVQQIITYLTSFSQQFLQNHICRIVLLRQKRVVALKQQLFFWK